MRLRLLLTFVLATSALACSSNGDEGSVDSGTPVNKCIAAGGVCAQNFPFRCAPGDEPATDPDRSKACGKSTGDNPVDVPCCMPGTTSDTGVDAEPDSASEAGDTATEAGDTATEAGDAATEAGETDAATDAVEAG